MGIVPARAAWAIPTLAVSQARKKIFHPPNRRGGGDGGRIPLFL